MSLVNFKPKNVEFVSYTGGWPNLCSGVLTLKIHGEEHRFGYRLSLIHISEPTRRS